MAKRKGRRTSPNVLEAQAFSLEEHLDIESHAERFELPVERVADIANEVQDESGPALVSITRSENELREVFKALYDAEIADLQLCPWADCGKKLHSIEHAIVHWRIRHLIQSNDPRVVRAVMKDIEEVISATDEKGFEAVLDIEERKALKESFRRRQLLTN